MSIREAHNRRVELHSTQQHFACFIKKENTDDTDLEDEHGIKGTQSYTEDTQLVPFLRESYTEVVQRNTDDTDYADNHGFKI